jgi:ketosteroid isomerase-like protein
MCNFLSVLILKNGDVLHHPMLDSHADLVTYFKLPDADAYISHFAKAELAPDNWLDVATWRWRLDEETRPRWLTETLERGAEDQTRRIAGRMLLVDGKHRLVVDGCWIVGGTAIVHDVRAGRIVHVRDFAQIHGVGGSAQIHNVRGSAQIHNVRGSAQIHGVGGSAQIRDVWGSAQIRDVGGSAQIHSVWGSAQLDDSAKAHVVTKTVA